MSGDDVPSCWICLEEGPDQLGKSLVRDCSCRGDTAGYAHLSCIKEFAQRKSRDLGVGVHGDDLADFPNAWQKCSHCHQPYQHELAMELSNSLLLFLDENYPLHMSPLNHFRHIDALSNKISAIMSMDYRNRPDLIEEGLQTSCKMWSLAQKMRLGADPTSVLVGKAYEASAHEQTGLFMTLTKENYKEGIKHYEMARDMRLSFSFPGNESRAKVLDGTIALMKSRHDGKRDRSSVEENLKKHRDIYEDFFRDGGESSVNAMRSGMNLVDCLTRLGHGIESERLMSKLAAISLRVNGPEHDFAKKFAAGLEISKQRVVYILSQPEEEYEALQYEAEGDEYVVKQARRRETVRDRIILLDLPNCEVFTIAAKNICWRPGTPVVCHGLKNAAHLNGMIGDARKWIPGTGRYEVHFEDKSLKPAAVKPENLRIVFELPPAADSDADEKEVSTATAMTAETQGEEAATSLLAELDLEETESSTSNKKKGRKKKGKKNRKKK